MKKLKIQRLDYFVLFLLVQVPWVGVGSFASESSVTDDSKSSSDNSSQRDITAPAEVTSGGGGSHGGGGGGGGGHTGGGGGGGGSHMSSGSEGMSSGGGHMSAPSGGSGVSSGGGHSSVGASSVSGSHESAPSSVAPSSGGSHIYAPAGGAPSSSGSHTMGPSEHGPSTSGAGAESSTSHSHTQSSTSSSNLSHPVGGAPSGSTSAHSVFPSHTHGDTKGSVSTHSDPRGNNVSNQHMNQVNFANQRVSSVMRSNPQIQSQVRQGRTAFASHFHSAFHRNDAFFHDQFHHFHNTVFVSPAFWSPWWGLGFYGAWWWGFYPCPDIGVYFYNPMVYWFYTPYWNDYYYRTWYAGDYSADPNTRHAFPYYGVWYPTENLKQLLLGASAMSAERQAVFRAQIESFTQLLTQALANESKEHVTLSKGDIALTHYEMLKNDEGVLLEGGVALKGTTHHFKGLLNLNGKDTEKEHQTQVFVANVTDKPPSDDQKKEMERLNKSIDDVRGGPEPSPSPAPASSPPTSASPGNTPSGEVSADPQK